ncbi:hypothetical protein DCL23_21330 [Citrobacter freundii]|nr:hypothetical protein C6985_10890 [Escherichia coli]PUU62662.1 hypothetical protein DCL23_21330 [Citrobacter freundii]RVS79313.1 hypothetical protein EOK89_22875 [Citrobacter freundii]
MIINVIISLGRGRSNLCDRAPSGLPASSYFYTREKSNLTRSIAYGWNGGAFRASAKANGAQGTGW